MSVKTMRGTLEDIAWQHLQLATEYSALRRYFEATEDAVRQLEVGVFEARHLSAYYNLVDAGSEMDLRLRREAKKQQDERTASWKAGKSNWR